jgi:hypothetical protein
MKKIITFILIFFITVSTVLADVDSNDLKDIDKLIKDGEYQKALKKHTLFFEESKTSKGMGGVRLSFALSSWVKLGRKYPPALTELIKLRDLVDIKVRSGKSSFSDFHDLSSINRELKNNSNTIDVFNYLDKHYPSQAKAGYHAIEKLLINKKYYQLCSKYMGDPIYKYESLRHRRETNLNSTKTHPSLATTKHYKYIDKTYIDGVLNLLVVLNALNNREAIDEIHLRASQYFGYKQILQTSI